VKLGYYQSLPEILSRIDRERNYYCGVDFPVTLKPSLRSLATSCRPNPATFSLKISTLRPDTAIVVTMNLFPHEVGFTPRPAWQVIEAARHQCLTGELELPTDPPTRIYLRDGVVYFADRTDCSLPVRLMREGVINREQMHRGTLIVNGVEHIGRMFDADPTIDRDSVELCVELFTDDVMVGVADELVDGYELILYRRHPSGLDRWYPHGAAVTEPMTEAVIEPVTEPVTVTEQITRPVPVTPAAASTGRFSPPGAPRAPVVPMAAPTAPAVVSPEIDAQAIADEVAEAIRRAFAGSNGI
jgi:hypothetical protein